MSRKFEIISEIDLVAKLDLLDDSYFIKNKDLKVSFDFENFEYEGIKKLGNLTYVACIAGGDWEHSVYFIGYWDGKKIRLYVPTKGNVWNTTTKKAYGNDEEADIKNVKKRYNVEIEESDDIDFDFDYEEIKNDIIKRFDL